MKILIAGSSGFIGIALTNFLRMKGHEVYQLKRRPVQRTKETLVWDPANEMCESDQLEGFNAAINLCGESIGGFWSESKKKRILESRVQSTKVLSACLSELQNPPQVLINASAMGYYGSQGDTVLTEQCPNGSGFLAQVCRQWEEATATAKKRGIRVITPRIGIVLSTDGGALSKMILPFKLGLGGKLGSGTQYMSWITIDDLVRVILFLISSELIEGPVNADTPNPVTNEEFTKTLGKILKVPTFMSLPESMLRMILREMADETLLASTRMEPARLQAEGYSFLYPDLEGSLHHLLKR